MIAALHTLHVLVVALGTLAVAGVLRNAGRDDRAVDALRRLGPDGVVAHAEQRARRTVNRPVITRGVVLICASTAFAAAIHTAVGPEHFREGVRFGVFFVLLSLAQFTLAYTLARRPDERVLIGLGATNLGTAALWLATRLVALPFGLDAVEPFGFWDSAASAAEVIAFGVAVWTVRTLPTAQPGRAIVRTPVSVG